MNPTLHNFLMTLSRTLDFILGIAAPVLVILLVAQTLMLERYSAIPYVSHETRFVLIGFTLGVYICHIARLWRSI